MTQGIYLIRHRDSGRTYVGRSVNIELRWSQHRVEAKLDRATTLIYNAMRKYGVDAFDYEVVEVVERVDDLPFREAAHIARLGTMKPGGYNLGGTKGGFPSREQVDAMPQEERDRWRDVMARAPRAGHDALRLLRSDPEYDAKFRSMRAMAARKREANIRAKRAADPAFDREIAEKRSRATAARAEGYQHKSAASFRKRMSADPEFSARVKENRRRAGLAAHANRTDQ